MGMSMRVAGPAASNSHTVHLAPEEGDSGFIHNVRRFSDRMERAVLEANREVIGRELVELDRDSFLRLTVRVAELRARYLKLGLSLSRGPIDPARVRELMEAREAFEEMRAVVEAAERVVERGYVRLPE